MFHWRRTLSRLRVLCLTCLIATTTCSCSAQQIKAATPASTQNEITSLRRTWQVGAYASGGFAPNYIVGSLNGLRYRKEQQFYTVTFEAGRMLAAPHGPSILKGRPEALVEITPFWLTHSPEQTSVVHSNNPFLDGREGTFPGYYEHGVSFVPLMFRWNFTNSSNRHIPWVQAGAGVLWTTNIFPQGGGYPGSYTSRFNFTPQVGAGENLFVRKNQSLNIGLRVIQFNNAGLGDINPVPYTLNFSIGYSWWK